MRIGASATRNGTAGVAVLQRGGLRLASASADQPFAQQITHLLHELLRCDASLGEPTTSITVDVSGILSPDFDSPVTVIRIAPRAPIDAGHEMSQAPGTEFTIDVVHIAGGHTILGDPLVPLDSAALTKFARSAPPGARYVVSGVGSLVNPEHELLVGRLLLEHAAPASIQYAHQFSHGASAVRERTALFNSSLLAHAESLGTALGLSVERIIPRARLYVTTNDGGSIPVARLPFTPVHSMHAGRSTELIGAAALCELDEGRIIVSDATHTFFGEVIAGVPSVVPTYRDEAGLRIATQSANLLPLTESVLRGRTEEPIAVTHGLRACLQHDVPVRRHYDGDLRALGAACAPLSEWANRIVNVNNAAEMDQALAAAQARVDARLVSFGSTPSKIRILESRVIATAYQHPRVVSVRVRGVAGESTGTILSGGDPDETR